MPLKFDKEMSTHLFKFVNTVKISYNPFDMRTTSAREIVDRMHAPRYKKANPRLKLDIEIHDRPSAPFVEFHFVDGTNHIVNPSNTQQAKDILFNVHLEASRVDAEYEMAGKNVEDER
mmetsp:Transcript_17803/g.23046  ORF Transcript_17803/g.23046 Transcript_17803/m.23046 type:complete len:118 (-) Transcript_17803:144-497(-)|eukprot:CAMPEP_0198137202 /NCGR_PEP_ID=MMETSP1443-20131203/731_1 /TAXON_ID=186043 /ORGANISM="Entomoneis sp., Strain CCMP2396" /LENGTH=117 /DNA_ID=CAMNT_0043798555 /DNA_START=125 /DNA_END=478 /DNA_ORIENTATION=-